MLNLKNWIPFINAKKEHFGTKARVFQIQWQNGKFKFSKLFLYYLRFKCWAKNEVIQWVMAVFLERFTHFDFDKKGKYEPQSLIWAWLFYDI